MSEMLSAYQAHFCETVMARPDRNVQEAKALVERVNRIVTQSGIGTSMCTLVDHIKYWDAWSKRENFQEYVGFPATDATGTRDKTTENYDRRTIDFRYSGVPDTLIFIDHGTPVYETAHGYGTLELVAIYKPALGIDISRKIDTDYDWWKFSTPTIPSASTNPRTRTRSAAPLASSSDYKRTLQPPIHRSLLSRSILPFYTRRRWRPDSSCISALFVARLRPRLPILVLPLPVLPFIFPCRGQSRCPSIRRRPAPRSLCAGLSDSVLYSVTRAQVQNRKSWRRHSHGGQFSVLLFRQFHQAHL